MKKKYKDVAEEMQVSVNTVKTQLARALKLLREGFETRRISNCFLLFLYFLANSFHPFFIFSVVLLNDPLIITQI